eukprot:4957012-Prymnesium_polylepis.2
MEVRARTEAMVVGMMMGLPVSEVHLNKWMCPYCIRPSSFAFRWEVEGTRKVDKPSCGSSRHDQGH